MANDASQIRFVGREPELNLLKAIYADAESGRLRLVLIGGAAGMGKARLVRELRNLIDERATVVQGRCYEGAQVAYWPFIEVMRSCLEQRPDALKDIGKREADAVLRHAEVAEGQRRNLGAGCRRRQQCRGDQHRGQHHP